MGSSKILKDHSDSTIKDAIEANLIEYFTHYCKQIKDPPGVDIYVGDDMIRVFTGLPYPIWNVVLRTNFNENNLENKVVEVINFFKQRDQSFYWVISPFTRPQNLGDILIAHGLSKSEWDSPSMAVTLRNLDEVLFQEAIDRSGISLKRIESKKDLKTWSKLLGLKEIEVKAFYDLSVVDLGKGTETNLFNYLAYLDGKPVGASMVLCAAGVAGLYWVYTQKEHRGKGIGTAVTMAPLFDARERGYEVGVLEASDMGYNVYLRMGFKKYYDYLFYRFPPEKKSET